jgi:hypothetical protein
VARGVHDNRSSLIYARQRRPPTSNYSSSSDELDAANDSVDRLTMTSYDLVALGHPPTTASFDPCIMHSMIFLCRSLQFLNIPFKDFMMMNMSPLVWLWYFYGNNIYSTSANILCANLMIFINISHFGSVLRSKLKIFMLITEDFYAQSWTAHQ